MKNNNSRRLMVRTLVFLVGVASVGAANAAPNPAACETTDKSALAAIGAQIQAAANQPVPLTAPSSKSPTLAIRLGIR
jgi:hypothetical protein